MSPKQKNVFMKYCSSITIKLKLTNYTQIIGIIVMFFVNTKKLKAGMTNWKQ